ARTPSGWRDAEGLLQTARVTLAPRTPIIVGVGQVTDRDASGREPAALAAEALRRAADDTGLGRGLLDAVDAIYTVACLGRPYRDLGAVVADQLGLGDVDRIQSNPIGGDSGQLMVNEAAAALLAGDYELVLVTGAEAGASQARARKAGTTPTWTEQGDEVEPTRVVGVDKPGWNGVETAVGLPAPIHMYSLLETAVRARVGHTPEEHAEALAGLWSAYSEIAATNPYAWLPQAFSAEQIGTPSASNRMVAAPYTKLMCANLAVDMASGLVLTTVEAAERRGIPREKWVYLHAGAAGQDEWFVSERADLASSPAIRALGTTVLKHAGLSIDDVAYVDLYACFPSAVQIAALELGLPLYDPARPLTVTGGLGFGGGPGNNYGGHAIATTVQRLREDPTAFGLTTSLGYYATKHAMGIMSATPPGQPFQHLRPEIDLPPPRKAFDSYEGEAVLESHTVPFGRNGEPDHAVLSLLAPSGDRVLLQSRDAGVIQRVLTTDVLGAAVAVSGGEVRFLS
ncbi:MAG: enoyl-CoA hydratase, partial [Marmoricola sp.]